MTKLTDIQLVILGAACQRPNRIVLPLPERLKGGAAQKVVGALLAKGFVAEVDAGLDAPVWRPTGDGRGVTLVATEAALEALGLGAKNRPTAEPTAPAEPSDSSRVPQRPRSRQRPAQRPVRARSARGRSRRS